MLGHRPLVPEDYFSMVKRRWWIVLLPLLLMPILSYSVSYTVPPEYVSQTLVLVRGQQVAEGYVKPVLSEDLTSQLASMQEQILSRSRLQPILERFELFKSYGSDMDARIDMMRKSIQIRPIHSEVGGGLPGFYISYMASDPRIAQAVCTEVTSMFTNESLKHHELSAEGTTDFLKGQLDNAKRNLDQQDAKLAEFETRYMGRLPGDEGTNSNMLSSLNTQLEASTQDIARKEQDRSMIQSMLAQATNSPTVLPGSSTPTVVSMPNPELDSEEKEMDALQAHETDLLTHYTSDYPEVISVRRQIADLRKKMALQASAPTGTRSSGSGSVVRENPAVQQLRAQLRSADLGIANARSSQGQIQGRIHTYEGKLEASPAVEQQYKQLTRDHETAQAFYNDLLGKINTATMSTDLEKRQEGEHFQVMDAANLPDSPSSPKRSVFAISGAAFGLALGLAIAGLLEYRDTTLRTERDVWAFTNLPTLGIIPASNTPEIRSRKGFRGLLRHLRIGKRKNVQPVGVNG